MSVEITHRSSVAISCFHGVEPFTYLWMLLSKMISFVIEERSIYSLQIWSHQNISSAEFSQKERTMKKSQSLLNSHCNSLEILFQLFFLLLIHGRIKKPFFPCPKKFSFKLSYIYHISITQILIIQCSKSLFQIINDNIWLNDGISINLNSRQFPLRSAYARFKTRFFVLIHVDFLDSIWNLMLF